MDNHATTRVDPRVVEAMLPYFSEEFGNAGSTGHLYGTQAKETVDRARQSIAANLGAKPSEIVFTSGATESNNLAIHGLAAHRRRRGDHLVSVRTEHHSVLGPIAGLVRRGYQAKLLDVEPHGSAQAGWLDPKNVASALCDDTCLVSVMLANNEIGVIQPLAEIGAICRERGVLLHCDATQAVGKLPVDMGKLGVDLLSFSAHKIYGPKGVGALVVRSGTPAVRLQPQITGGGQQEDRRSGTLNVPGIVGMAWALELCMEDLQSESERLAALRNRLAEGIMSETDGALLCGPALDACVPAAPNETGHPLRLPGNLNLAFRNVDGEALLMAMPELALSSGATCASADPNPSHVLLALGIDQDTARSSLRFGLGRFNTDKEVDFAIEKVVTAVNRLRKLGNG